MARTVLTSNGRGRGKRRDRASDRRTGGSAGIKKCPTGISGLDQITGGGLPSGRTSLVCGSAGCGKTLFGLEFLARGAGDHGEPGVFVAFEESVDELAANAASLGLDVRGLMDRGLLVVDHVRVERSEIHETGEYDLEGLFVRLGHAIDTLGAKRVVLDTLEALFGGLGDHATLRSEIRRLFRWLKDKGVTAVVTGEGGQGQLTRQGLEEYVSDCVILLDNRVRDQISTRRLRIVKYRGSGHGSNEYPFLIDRTGISVLPVTAMSLGHEVSHERVPLGVAGLDEMLGGGPHRGSSVLVTGGAGTGKTSLAAHFAAAACRRGERCLYFAFEESPPQIVRNMRSIGIDLERWIRSGRLMVHADRPTAYGLEMHLAMIHRMIETSRPDAVVLDPLTSLVRAGAADDVGLMLMRLIDSLKARGITGVFTGLSDSSAADATEFGVGSLMDTWLVLREVEAEAERNRLVHVVKSRGTAHSNQVREFTLSGRGMTLCDVYIGRGGGMLTGSARIAQEAADRLHEESLLEEDRERRTGLERRLAEIRARIGALEADLSRRQAELSRLSLREESRARHAGKTRAALARSRRAAPSQGAKR